MAFSPNGVLKSMSGYGSSRGGARSLADAIGGQAIASRQALEAQAWQQEMLQDAAIHYLLYKMNPWVRACIDWISQAASADRYTIDAADDTQRRAVETYLAELSPGVSFNRLLRGIYRDLQINGNWYGRLTFSRRRPVGLFRVDFRRIVPDPPRKEVTQGGEVERYAIYNPTDQFILAPEYVPREEIVHLTLNDAGENGMGLSQLESLDYTLALDESARRFQQGFFTNGTKAGDVFVSKEPGTIPPELVERERQYVEQNFSQTSQSWSPMFLEGSWELASRGGDLHRDADFLELRRWNLMEVSSVLSFPLSLLSTDLVGALGSNGKQQDRQLLHDSVISPLQEQVMQDFSALVFARSLKNSTIRLEPPRASRIRPEDVDAAQGLLRIGATGNQVLGLLNIPPIEGMDEPLYQMGGMLFVGVPGDPNSLIITSNGVVNATPQMAEALSTPGKALARLMDKDVPDEPGRPVKTRDSVPPPAASDRAAQMRDSRRAARDGRNAQIRGIK